MLATVDNCFGLDSTAMHASTHDVRDSACY